MSALDRVPVLTFVNGDREGELFALAEDNGALIGRSPEADLVLRDDSVSRKHVRLYRDEGNLWLRDLGSRNGTRVNGSQVARYRLSTGDRLSVGATLLRVSWMERDQIIVPQKEDSKGRAMSGSLDDIPLADVLQWLATSRKSGVLDVHGPRLGKLTLDKGLVFNATMQGVEVAKPEKALLRMMRWDRGFFALSNFEKGESPEGSPVSLEHILMESARTQDELSHLGESRRLPKERVWLRFPPKTPWSELSAEQVDLLSVLARAELRKRTWDDVLCSQETEDLGLTKQVLELHAAGVVLFDDEDGFDAPADQAGAKVVGDAAGDSEAALRTTQEEPANQSPGEDFEDLSDDDLL